SDDLTVVLLESEKKRLLAASCYMAHDRTAPPEELRSVVEASPNDQHLIVGADANAHHCVWGSPDINDRGESLLDFILTTNLSIANVGEEHTFVGPTSSNVLDLTLVRGQVTMVSEWRVLERPSFSDHKYIQFQYEFEHFPKPAVFRNPRNTNWGKFKKTITTKLSASPGKVNSAEDIEKSLETLSKELLDAYHASCPISEPRKRTKPPWWNRDLSFRRNKLREFFKIAKLAKDEVINGEYKVLLRDYKKEIRKAQRSSWRNFCSNIETAPETARLRKLLSKQPTIQSQLKRDNGQWTEGSEEALTALMQAHFPGCTEVSDANKHQDLATGEENLPNDLLSSKKIHWAIDSFTGIKAPGLDGIFPAMLQVAKDVITPWLCAIYSACLSTGYIPI
ncbi:hypothetical protein KR054_011526, partial [Drosophila jambulina]